MKLSKDNNALLGTNLRAIRLKMGLSQEKIAELVGVTTNYICQIERGDKSPSVEMLIRLSEKLPASLDRLVFGDSVTNRQAHLLRLTKGLSDQQMDGIIKIVSTIRKDLYQEDGE